MPASSIAVHPQRDKIIAALVAKQPYRNIIAWANPTVTTGSLSRFKRNAMAELRGTVARQAERQVERSGTERIYDTGDAVSVPEHVQASAMLAVSSPFRRKLDQLWSITENTLQRAADAVRVVKNDEGELVVVGSDLAAIAPLLAQGHRNAELDGRASGELDSAPAQVNNLMISLNMPRGD